MTLPICTAGIPIAVRNSTLMSASMRINPWITICSRLVGHGTATRKNRIGNAKWRSQLPPPAR